MNTKAISNRRCTTNAARTFVSVGERFADGSVIELISGSSKPSLLLWNGRKANVGPSVEHGGCTYEAPDLDRILYRATRFPSECRDYGSARALFDGIRDLFQRHLRLPESESGLIACFVISTWLADRLPSAPGLTISGPDEELGIDVLHLLSCVCRHPLMLAEINPGGFRSLPMHLSLTLLLNQQVLRPNMQRLLRASSYRGLHWPGNRGGVVNLYGPKAIFCGHYAPVDTLEGGMIHISVAPSQLQPSPLDEPVQNEIANLFQPRLLMYRLKNAEKVGEARVDISNFTFATGRLARSLAMSFPEDLELGREIAELLGPEDEDARAQRANSIEFALVEVLLGFIHQQELTEMKVGDLTDLANGLLRSRGEILTYGAEQVGWKLRGLNLIRHRTSSGSLIKFDRRTSHQVHRLAREYNLGSCWVETCPECAVVGN